MSAPYEPRQLIDGKLVESSTGATFDNVNPATEEVLGQVYDASADDVGDAIGAARRAFDETTWASDHAFRQRCMTQLGEAMERAQEELRTALVLETGCPVMLTHMVQIAQPLTDIAYWTEQATAYEYEHFLPERESMGGWHRRLIRREPIGVVAAITPWNFPLYLNIAKLGPALAAGNTVVLKPAPDTPWMGTMLGKLIVEETDIPAGVVNIVTPSDHLTGEVLTTDPRVDMVTFTGSTAVGKRIMACGSETLKKTFLELGGKSAWIALEDAELGDVLPGAVGGVCTHAGQGCAIPTRLLLHASRYDEGVEMAKTIMSMIPYGDPTDPVQRVRAGGQRQATGPGDGVHREGARRKGRRCWSAGGGRRSSTAGSSWSRRSSPTWIPTRRSPRTRSSVRCSASSATRTTTTPCGSPTTPATGCAG